MISCKLRILIQQIFGRLRIPGTCTVFTTIGQLQYIANHNSSKSAKEMAQVIIDSRSTNSLALNCFNICDGIDRMRIGEAGSMPGSIDVAFQIDALKRFCQSLRLQVSELHVEGGCTFCNIIGNQDARSHSNSDCPWSKKTCNKCFQTGHNRAHCQNEACKIPHGFCVMCLMPVNAVYDLHSGRYGRDCKGELRDCLKPIVTLLFYSNSIPIIRKASEMLWSPSNPRPQTFNEYWEWLWVETDDHLYGILQVLNAVVQAVNCQSSP